MRARIPSPWGTLEIEGDARAVGRLRFRPRARPAPPPPGARALQRAARALAAYAQGRPIPPRLPLAPPGTAFEHRVWEAVSGIPFGETRTYGELARALRTSPRAVGRAVAKNPLPILIPCHRVVGRAGLCGYSGGRGLETKRALLAHEARHLRASRPVG